MRTNGKRGFGPFSLSIHVRRNNNHLSPPLQSGGTRRQVVAVAHPAFTQSTELSRSKPHQTNMRRPEGRQGSPAPCGRGLGGPWASPSATGRLQTNIPPSQRGAHVLSFTPCIWQASSHAIARSDLHPAIPGHKEFPVVPAKARPAYPPPPAQTPRSHARARSTHHGATARYR